MFDMELVFSQMSPPDWPLVSVGIWGQVANMWMTPAPSSSSTIGRVWLSWPVPKRYWDQLPVVLRTRRLINGEVLVLIDVLTAAYTCPAASALRLIWSSASLGPLAALSLACQVVSGSASRWIAKYITAAF